MILSTAPLGPKRNYETSVGTTRKALLRLVLWVEGPADESRFMVAPVMAFTIQSRSSP
jgi:hypothetical protein